MGFNDNLKGELEYKGMLVKELADKTGIPKQTIDNYLLHNGSMPPADKAVAIAQALDVTVEYLVTGRETHNKKKNTKFFSPEFRSISDRIETLQREKRKIVENTVDELVNLLEQPLKDEPVTLTLLQKVFLQLIRQ